MERMHVRRVSNGWVVERFTPAGGDRSVEEKIVPASDPALAIEDFAKFLGAKGSWTPEGAVTAAR